MDTARFPVLDQARRDNDRIQASVDANRAAIEYVLDQRITSEPYPEALSRVMADPKTPSAILSALREARHA